MRETAKMEKILMTVCIPQKDTRITAYFITALTGKRKAIPEKIIKPPSEASRVGKEGIFHFFVKIPAAMLPRIVATANALSAAP